MTEHWIPKDKHELIAAIEREWKLLLNVVENLSDKQMFTPDEGGWSPKDNLAHLAEWMNLLMGYHLDRRPAHEVLGLSENVTKGWDMEVINPVLFERNRDRSTEEALDWIKNVYAELVKKLDALPFEDLLKPRFDDDQEKSPVLIWVLANTTWHFKEHRETVERGIKGMQA